jgi:hypothetical protein
MSSHTSRIILAAPIVRSIAIAALVGTSFLVSPLTTARADSTTAAPIQYPQTTSPQAGSPQAGVEAPEFQEETVEQRIANLHEALKITSDQEAKWADVAQTIRENTAAMERLVNERTNQAPKSMTAVQDLRSYEKFTQEHASGLKKLIVTFEGVYNQMPDTQKKIADKFFAKFGRNGAPSHS